MFSRNSAAARDRDRDAAPDNGNSRFSVNLNSTNSSLNNNSSVVSNNNAEEGGGGGGVKRVGRGSEKKSRPHSWHSTLQRGLARARSRSSGRQDKEARDKQKRASSALDKGEHWQEREESDCGHIPETIEICILLSR